MVRRSKEEFKRKRKPSIFIVCEGRNKTERTYFNHFNERYAPYNLRIINCESTDILSMAQKAYSIYLENDLDADIGDKVYCLVDLDLGQHKYDKFIKARQKFKKIKIILIPVLKFGCNIILLRTQKQLVLRKKQKKRW